ncbi:MAG: DUF5106 domain-containing protein [Bacteroidales bacterium]|nr:DUF5106 domain-containing protein [Bacteroidales bacterium]
MKRIRNLIFLLLAITIVNRVTAQKNSYEIKIQIKGLKDTLCHLADRYGDKQYLKDSARADSKGNIVFKGTKKLPEGIYLVILPNKSFFEIIMTDKPFFSFYADTSHSVASIKIKGSPENIRFYDYIKFVYHKRKSLDSLKLILKNAKTKEDSTVVKNKIKGIDKEVESHINELMKKNPDDLFVEVLKSQTEIKIPDPPKLPNGKIDSNFQYFYYKAHYFDNIDFNDERIVRTPVYHSKLDYFFKNIVVQLPDSIIKEGDIIIEKAKNNKELFKYTVYYLTYNSERSPVMGMDAAFVHMVEKYYNTGQAYWVDSASLAKLSDRARILKPLLLGKPAPFLILQDTLGQNISNYDIRTDFLIQIFWEPSCGHCKKELPRFVELNEKLKKENINEEMLAICTGNDVQEWKKFIREKNINLINGMDLNGRYFYKELYDVFSTPVVYILNSKKQIIAKRIGVEQVEQFIKAELKLKNKK